MSVVTVFCLILPMFGPVKGCLSRQNATFGASTAEPFPRGMWVGAPLIDEYTVATVVATVRKKA